MDGQVHGVEEGLEMEVVQVARRGRQLGRHRLDIRPPQRSLRPSQLTGLKTFMAEQTTTTTELTGLKTPTAEEKTTTAKQTGLKIPVAEPKTTTTEQTGQETPMVVQKATSEWMELKTPRIKQTELVTISTEQRQSRQHPQGWSLRP